jgi:hypothetical protein
MGDTTLNADQERQGWTRPSNIAWAVAYLIGTVVLVLLWAFRQDRGFIARVHHQLATELVPAPDYAAHEIADRRVSTGRSPNPRSRSLGAHCC